MWQGWHGGRSGRQPVTLDPQSGNTHREMNAGVHLFSHFSSVQDTSAWDVVTHVQSGPSYLSQPNLDNPSQMYPGLCPLGDPRSWKVDNQF